VTRKVLYGLVLAGGESRRMGQDKALLMRDGKSQLEHVATLLAEVTGRVFVSTRKEQCDEQERSQFDQIVDRYENMGPIAGIMSAMDEYPEADWLVVACDLPNIDAATLQYLIENKSGTAPFTAFKSSHDDLPEPLCAIYAAGSRELIQSFIDDGARCPRKILIRADTHLLSQPNPAALDNINTPADLQRSVLAAAS
jgi:molybdopterin-guanine dinucleotide biosynthesis protein A